MPGIGETTAQLVSRGARVESVELDRRAVAEAECSGPHGAAPRRRVEDVMTQLRVPDSVITNPPRTGMDERVTTELERVRPQLCRVCLLRSGDAGPGSPAAAQLPADRGARL